MVTVDTQQANVETTGLIDNSAQTQYSLNPGKLHSLLDDNERRFVPGQVIGSSGHAKL